MPYILEICVAGKTVEISKYHSYRWNCKGEKREKRKQPTTEQQEKVNLRMATKTLRRLMNNNFSDEDSMLLTLDFRLEERPKTSVEMQNTMKTFLKRLRRKFKKKNLPLKYIYVKELGPRGGAHIHMLMTKCEIDILQYCWSWGGINIQPLHTDGQYEKIAKYFVKYADRTIKTEGKLIGKKWYPSRNLKQPTIIKKIIKQADTFRETPQEKKGYYLEKDSVYSGITKDGYGFFTYTLHKLMEKRRLRP
ncbi:MAG: rolling circle replication-associated protein [Acetivibrio ethanolgignens]